MAMGREVHATLTHTGCAVHIQTSPNDIMLLLALAKKAHTNSKRACRPETSALKLNSSAHTKTYQ
jgi:hypothetical protein